MTDSRRTIARSETESRLALLGARLKARRLDIDRTARDLAVSKPKTEACCSVVGQRHLSGAITFRPDAVDRGHPWFFNSWNRPIAEAALITDAAVAIKGYLAGEM